MIDYSAGEVEELFRKACGCDCAISCEVEELFCKACDCAIPIRCWHDKLPDYSAGEVEELFRNKACGCAISMSWHD